MVTKEQIKSLTPKNFWASKSVWLGVITTVVSLLTAAMGQEFIMQYPQVVAGIGMVVGFLTVVLRYLTDRPITPPTGGDTTPPANLPQPSNPNSPDTY